MVHINVIADPVYATIGLTGSLVTVTEFGVKAKKDQA